MPASLGSGARRAGRRGFLRFRALSFLLLSAVVGLPLSSPTSAAAAEITLKERLEILAEVYREHIAAIDDTHVRMADGTEVPIDDGRQKSHAEKLADADIEDMLSQIYPVTGCRPAGRPIPRDFDPGRIRNEAFFKSVYGASRKEVSARLVRVDWYGQTLPVSSTLGVDRKLAAVQTELGAVSASLRAYLSPSAGAFNWRPIAGTSRLSTHSYGIAIDISTAKSDYWRWTKASPDALPEPKHKIPDDIIAAFERQGFIWGGAWYHYDTMHFEYRPELIAIGELAKTRGCVR